MYESFFGLRKRPYAAAPCADFLVELPGVAEAVDRLDRCVRQGRGIGVLTGAAGLGKTHLCHWLARRWDAEYRTVVLPNAGFPTRRGVLQSILAELDQPYQRLSETELRLELDSACRAIRETSAGVVLLFDEAHRHSERILEEIRLIANLVEGGEPLVRIVLAGHLELEEKLGEPALAALNERVGELVTLPRLTAEESRRYLGERASFAGGELHRLFEADAVEVMVQACGGVPRCLNQLADHGLLLGYVAERRPVDESLLREALDDLKRLPLHWHDPLPSSRPATEQEVVATGIEPFAAESSLGFDDVIEVGGPEDRRSVERPDVWNESSPSQWAGSAGTPAHETDFVDFVIEEKSRFEVNPQALPEAETIRDRFARLDAADARKRWAELVEQGVVASDLLESSPSAALRAGSGHRHETRPTPNPLELLDRIEPLIAQALAEGDGFSELCPRAEPPVAIQFEPLEGVAQNSRAAVATKVTEVAAAPRVNVRPSTLFSDLRRRKADADR